MLQQEQDPWVLREVAEVLGEIGTVDVIPLLENHLYHERTQTRWMVRKAIVQIQQRHELL
jgi:hypothetical protein